jgi:mono/diheme cytochrome c family protein
MEKIIISSRILRNRAVKLTLVIAVICLGALGASSGGAADERDDAAARAAFLKAYPVFMHPRCLNCHPAGDAPLQGDDSLPHAQNVQRGPEGRGRYALKCANCHQRANLAGANMPPGNPKWHMPPPGMRMVFQGKSPGELCRQLKDPAQNGGMTLEELIHHVTHDKLVLWGWDPGDGRTKPPSHAEFVDHLRTWVNKGAACPE